MTRVVEVRTGARLHFGLLTTGRSPGRLGGIGMMIDRPGYLLRAKIVDEDRIDADPETANRVRRYLESLRGELQDDWPGCAARRYAIEVPQTIPSHRGLGSGTQLACAVVTSMSKLLRFKPFVPTGSLGRGERSLVGLSGFGRGGFIADPGDFGHWEGDSEFQRRSGSSERIPAERPVPKRWRVVVILPRLAEGPSGDPEREAFGRLGPMPEETTDCLGDLIATRILPGLAGGDFHAFASGVAEFNRLVGEHFAPVQGGVYAHPLIRELSRTLADTDWPYLAQSSWGPSAAVFCESEESAEALRLFLNRRISPEEAEVFIAAPKNDGATVTCLEQ